MQNLVPRKTSPAKQITIFGEDAAKEYVFSFNTFEDRRLYRPAQIFEPKGPLPISRSSFWARIKETGYPRPIKLGPRTTAFLGRDLNAMIARGLDA